MTAQAKETHAFVACKEPMSTLCDTAICHGKANGKLCGKPESEHQPPKKAERGTYAHIQQTAQHEAGGHGLTEEMEEQIERSIKDICFGSDVGSNQLRKYLRELSENIARAAAMQAKTPLRMRLELVTSQVLDALESDATLEQREAAFDALRDLVFP